MNVTYLNHSGFFLEMENAYFLFDYYKGTIPDMSVDKPLVVFVSHKHHDHYNHEIFDLIKKYPDTKFVLAKGTNFKKITSNVSEENVIVVSRNADYSMELFNDTKLDISTLCSTDLGVAFIIQYEGKTIYHAGDLNLWLWEGESKQYNNNMKANFMREMEKLKGKSIDVAFVPLDPRLENHSFDGMEVFLDYTDSKKVFPMHMWDDYSIISKFMEKHPEYMEILVPIGYNNQKWTNI